MGLFDVVDFDANDIKAVKSGNGSRAQIISILTSQTCGEPCWHAQEDICRCSCGGKNHGCLRTADGVQPARMSKIDGVPYKLAGVGYQLRSEAHKINCAAGYRYVEKAHRVSDGESSWWKQYRYTWSETDPKAPARVKYATKEQLAKWPELAAYRDSKPWEKPCLLWVREVMPERPTELVVDRETGLPLENQNPQ